jgi:hypothetical protein
MFWNVVTGSVIGAAVAGAAFAATGRHHLLAPPPTPHDAPAPGPSGG